MTREDTIKFLALIKVAYPTAFKDMDNDSKYATINMWQNTFPDVPFFIMELAFDHFRKVSKFPPTVAEIHEELRSLYYTALMDASVAKSYGDDNKLKKSMYIMSATHKFSRNTVDHVINYDNISDNLLETAEYKMIGGS